MDIVRSAVKAWRVRNGAIALVVVLAAAGLLVERPAGTLARVLLLAGWAVVALLLVMGRRWARQVLDAIRCLVSSATPQGNGNGNPPHEVRGRAAESPRVTPQQIRAILDIAASMKIAYQPIVDLSTRQPVGHEALSRFADAAPDVVYRNAHAVGLGIELELLAVNRAMAGALPEGYTSVNLSPAALTSRSFLTALDEIDGSRLVVELTEHVPVDDYDAIARAVAILRAQGGRLAVDDTGGGYASMRHVLALAPDVIKLDRSIIGGIDTDARRRHLAASLVRFAHETSAVLIAEGIERHEELQACIEVGVRFGQGYLLGRPQARTNGFVGKESG
jgi:EAL domain-containing protein (putative c-di-GMP-specific phosphodiesterase class I)